MDLIFLLTNFFFVCFVVYQRILVRYLIFLSKLKYTRKLEVRVVSSLSESSFALAYIGIEMHIFYVPLQFEGHQPQFTQGSFNNVIFHKRICITDVVLL